MSKRKKYKNPNLYPTGEVLKSKIIKLFEEDVTKPFTTKLVAKRLELQTKKAKKNVSQIVAEIYDEELIIRQDNGSYISATKPEGLIGRLDHVNPRFGYIVVDGEEDDIYVRSNDLLHAMDGDTVKVLITKAKEGKSREGRVLEIVERAKNEIVGRIELSPRFAFVIADNRKIHQDIFVSLKQLNGATHNDKVLLKITQWPGYNKSPEGKVSEVLGQAGENDAEIHSIMAEFNLPFRFPEQVEAAAAKLTDKITKEDLDQRKDLRDLTTFTIDPLDAKDFDDALSVEYLDNGNFSIGIHIADVSHYVAPGSILDNEAYNRATSVYLVDRTIPMLPEKLSNGLCSLRPNEDKFTFSAVFEINQEANVVKEWFGRTLTHSNHRFTYEDAQTNIENKEGVFEKELTLLNTLTKKLKAKRFKNGAINFETTEVRFKLDEKGKPIELVTKVRKDAHKLVEEFMLLANKKVAEYVYNKVKGSDKLPFVYRTHDNPDPEKIKSFSNFAKKFGHSMSLDEQEVSSSLNGLMTEIEGKPEQNILESLAIRAMSKAKYTSDENHHFGLAFEHYTHFTSPIRRYPDVMVHRLLQHYLEKGKAAERKEIEEKCVHSSEMEKRASDAERASIKFKQVEFMKYAEDKPYPGVISGLTEWGIYVEIIETKCEGMIKLADLKDDYYEFDKDNYRVIGQRNKKMYTLGDLVTVRVENTDIDRRIIDLIFAENDAH